MKVTLLTSLLIATCCSAAVGQQQRSDTSVPSASGQSAGNMQTAPTATPKLNGAASANNVPEGPKQTKPKQKRDRGASSGASPEDMSGRRNHFQSQRSSGRRIPDLKPMKTQSGSFPGPITRSSERQARQNEAASGSGQRTDRRSTQRKNSDRETSRLRESFLKNAMMFDTNSDQQLAANELRNLYILLASGNQIFNNFGSQHRFGSSQQHQNSGRIDRDRIHNRNNGSKNTGSKNTGSKNTGSKNTGSKNTGSKNKDAKDRQRSQHRLENQNRSYQSTAPTSFQSSGLQSFEMATLLAEAMSANTGSASQEAGLQETILLFLLLVLQFDRDGDGALDRSELQSFASALLNNDLNLNQAAVRSGGR